MRSREAVPTGAQTAASWPNCPRNRTSTPCCGPTMATWRQESGAPFLVSNSHQGNCGLTCPFRPPRVSSTRITQFSYKGGSKATWAAPFHLRRQWREVGCWLSPYLFRGGLVLAVRQQSHSRQPSKQRISGGHSVAQRSNGNGRPPSGQ